MSPPTTTALEATAGHDLATQVAAAEIVAQRDLRLSLDLAAKRTLDVLMAAALLLLCIPIFVLIAVLIKLDSRGPLFYRCRRVGRGGTELSVLKFRKMRDGASGPALTLDDDDRFTRIGPFLAATKLDELPQLINVLRGDMSLVGPRPEDAGFVDLRRAEYERILSVKPGMTGLTQLAFSNEREILGVEDAVDYYVERLLPQKIRIDTIYAARRSVPMDLLILLWTGVAVVLRREIAVNRECGRISVRRRPRAARTRGPSAALGYAGDRRQP